MAKQRIILKWSKKENDWINHYPNRNGRILGNNLFDMINNFKGVDGITLRQCIINAGYDPNSFKLTIDVAEGGN